MSYNLDLEININKSKFAFTHLATTKKKYSVHIKSAYKMKQ